MATIGKMFVASAIATGSVGEWLGFGDISHLFKPSEVQLYEFAHNHAKKFGKLPVGETIETHLSEELVHAPEPPAYYHELMQLRYVETELKLGMKAAADKLGVNDKDPEAALVLIAETVMKLIAKKSQAQISDFRDAYDEVVTDYVAKYTSDEGTGVRLGWPTLDAMTGGLVRGDMLSMVGRPGQGKTQALLYCAHHSWRVQEKPQLFVSMEMKPLPLKQRLIAMEAGIPGMKVKNAELSTGYLTKMKNSLMEIKGASAPFWLVDGNFAATVEDIWMIARQLKPSMIWIDGAYLVKHPRERDRFKRVAENADLMKQELSDIAPVAASWQFARPEKSKKKTQGGHTLDDIGYTDAIGQVSSLVLGMMAPDSMETMLSREIDILKGRNGELGKFKTRWDWLKMDFSELFEEAVTELQFL